MMVGVWVRGWVMYIIMSMRVLTRIEVQGCAYMCEGKRHKKKLERVLSVFSPLKIRNRSGSLDFPTDERLTRTHTHTHT